MSLEAGAPQEAGNGIIALSIQHLLTGGTSFADQGLIMIFHPLFESVTMHQFEGVNIKYTGEPVVTDYHKHTGHCFWRVPIKAPKGQTQTPKKLSTVEHLLLCKTYNKRQQRLSTAYMNCHPSSRASDGYTQRAAIQ